MRYVLVAVLSWGSWICGPLAASADPIQVTSGSMVLTSANEVGTINLAGTRGFSLDARIDPGEGSFDVLACNFGGLGCLGGATISVGAVFSAAALDGALSLDGMSWEIGDIEFQASVGMNLVGLAMLPSLGPSPITIPVPFRLADSRVIPPFPFEPADLIGGGTAFLDFFPRFDSDEGFPDAWVLERARYDFTSAEPVPEPATMWLLGTGVALVTHVRRRRRGLP